MAFKYLSWLLYPLFGCYAVYSLLYVEHKGWYSWVLSMLYGFLLTFGKFVSSGHLLTCVYLLFVFCWPGQFLVSGVENLLLNVNVSETRGGGRNIQILNLSKTTNMAMKKK